MTRNLYLGADLSPALRATSDSQLISAVTAMFAQVVATNFPERAKALAEEVAAAQPDLIGLQEVVVWRSQFPADFLSQPNATTVESDFLQLYIGALAERGLHYVPVAISTNFDLEVPRQTASGLQDIRLTDRDVILARSDFKTRNQIADAQFGSFSTNLVVSVAGRSFKITRGWTSVDITVGGKPFRFVTTHLESFSAAVQVAQGNELLGGPGKTELPFILAGDFNSSADGTGTATYGNLIASGLLDAWTLAGSGAGYTCCQAEDLRNPTSALESRIDLVLFRSFNVIGVDIVGENPADCTSSGLWPSDHAGVVTTLRMP